MARHKSRLGVIGWERHYGCSPIVFFTQEGSSLSEMTQKYLSGSHDKSWSSSLNAKERCFNASFLISFSIGYTWPSFTKGKEIILSHNSLQQQRRTIHKLKHLHPHYTSTAVRVSSVQSCWFDNRINKSTMCYMLFMWIKQQELRSFSCFHLQISN